MLNGEWRMANFGRRRVGNSAFAIVREQCNRSGLLHARARPGGAQLPTIG
jgi:hypothetical protein